MTRPHIEWQTALINTALVLLHAAAMVSLPVVIFWWWF